MLTNTPINDILLISAEDTDFLCLNSPLVCAKDLTVSSAEHRTGAFLLEGIMNYEERKLYNRLIWKNYTQEQKNEIYEKAKIWRQTPAGREYVKHRRTLPKAIAAAKRRM